MILIAHMTTKQVHISQIQIGDTIIHNNDMRTVCKRVLKNSEFMDKTLFGDSYNLGYKKVTKVFF